MDPNLQNRITVEPGKRSGKPCVRGMRITVSDVLEYLASGMTEARDSGRLPGPDDRRHSGLLDVRGRAGAAALGNGGMKATRSSEIERFVSDNRQSVFMVHRK